MFATRLSPSLAACCIAFDFVGRSTSVSRPSCSLAAGKRGVKNRSPCGRITRPVPHPPLVWIQLIKMLVAGRICVWQFSSGEPARQGMSGLRNRCRHVRRKLPQTASRMASRVRPAGGRRRAGARDGPAAPGLLQGALHGPDLRGTKPSDRQAPPPGGALPRRAVQVPRRALDGTQDQSREGALREFSVGVGDSGEDQACLQDLPPGHSQGRRDDGDWHEVAARKQGCALRDHPLVVVERTAPPLPTRTHL